MRSPTSLLKQSFRGAAMLGVAAFALMLGEPLARAQLCTGIISRVSDLTSAPTQNGMTQLQSFSKVGDRAFFIANNPAEGRAIWQTDGTALGTSRWSALGVPFSSSISPLYPTSDAVYILVSAQIYRATPASILLVTNGYSRTASSTSDNFIALGDKLVYASGAGVFGVRSDGAGGFIRDLLAPLPNLNGFFSKVSTLVVLNNRVLFAVSDEGATFPTTFYSSDGTAAGTSIISSPADPAPPTRIEQPIVFNNRVFFSAYDPEFGTELWSTDGTPAGTSRFADINLGLGASTPQILGIAGGKLFFWVYDDTLGRQGIYVTTGEAGNVAFVAEWLANGISNDQPRPLALEVNGKLLFRGGPSLNNMTGGELCVTDGTLAGTMVLADINPGLGNSMDFNFPARASSSGQRAYFLANTNTATPAIELWTTDGTPANTYRLLDAPQLAYATLPASSFAVVPDGATAYFTAARSPEGIEPWVTDGTPEGTHILKDINTYAADWGSVPGTPTVIAPGRVVFSAVDAVSGYEPWVTDGTGIGTQRIIDIAGGSYSSNPHAVSRIGNQGLIFSTVWPLSTIYAFLWDGSALAAQQLIPDPGLNLPTGFAQITYAQPTPNGTYLNAQNRMLLLSGSPPTLSNQTLPPTNVTPVYNPNNPIGVSAPFAGGIICSGSALGTGTEPVFFGSSPADARVIKNIAPGTNSSLPQGFTYLPGGGPTGAGGVLFFANTTNTGTEPWFTDGTDAGTVQIGDISPGPISSWPVTNDQLGITRQPPTIWNNRAFFIASVVAAVPATSLVVTNGTPAGTSVISLNLLQIRGNFLAATTQGVFFIASPFGASSDTELYITDGTAANTRRVIDLTPGSPGTTWQWIASADDRLYLATGTTTTQRFYVTQGTAATTTELTLPALGGPLTQSAPLGVLRNQFLFSVRAGTNYFMLRSGPLGSPAPCTAAGPFTTLFAPSVTSPLTGIALTPSRAFFYASDALLLNEPRAINLCPADFNNSGGDPGVQDVFDFLGAWFAGTLSADVTNNGVVGVDDVFAFLALWFGGC